MNIKITIGPHGDGGLAPITLRAPILDIKRDLDISFEELRRYCGTDDALALDFLVFASLCYVTDKMVPRRLMVDRWTRELDLAIPVSAPEQWTKALPLLQRALGFLTGDVWRISFVPLEEPLYRVPKKRLVSKFEQADAVCLFSGGLDSLTGAIDLLHSAKQPRVLLVGHHDGAAGEQATLATALSTEYGSRVRLLRMRVGHKPMAALETTLRSRSLLFMALGIYAARSMGAQVPLFAPENGVIALNVPLTPSRAGSCSTRTMHPFFLAALTEALQSVGLTNPLFNPLQGKTKGECLKECLNPSLLRSLSAGSASCSHPTRRQNWVRKEARNCGYCVPCLFRRAALHAAGWDNGNAYGFDVCRSELTHRSEVKAANDLRAMLAFLNSGYSPQSLEREIALIATSPNLKQQAAMLARGFDEVRALFNSKGDAQLRQAIAVAPFKTTTP